MSTADCKKLLTTQYPETLAKDWKRVSKFNNLYDTEIRLFNHPKVGQVWVNEDEQDCSTDVCDIHFVHASALKPSDFYVAFGVVPGDDIFSGPYMMAVYKPYFDTHKHFDSVHLGPIMQRLFPKGVTCSEDMEATFSYFHPYTVDQLRVLFRESGFLESDEAQAMIEEQ